MTESEKVAIEYTERFAVDHLNIDDAFFLELKAYFSDLEIFEITSVIAYLLANGRKMQVLKIEQACAL